MDHYVLLTRISEQPVANRACASLEDAGIPVMLEHVEVTSGGTRASNFRLFVPDQHVQAAQKLVSNFVPGLYSSSASYGSFAAR